MPDVVAAGELVEGGSDVELGEVALEVDQVGWGKLWGPPGVVGWCRRLDSKPGVFLLPRRSS